MNDELEMQYVHYRRAMLTGDDVQAWRVIQAIAKADPSDPDAQAERERLGRKFLCRKLDKVGEFLARDQTQEMYQLVGEIEASGVAPEIFEALPEQPRMNWKRAQATRCRDWLDHAERLVKEDNFKEVLTLLEQVKTVQAKYHFKISRDHEQRHEKLRAWATAEKGFHEAFDRFLDLLDRVENVGAANLSTLEVTQIRDDLDRLREELKRFDKPFADTIEKKYKECARVLDVQIGSGAWARRTVALVCAVMILALGGVVAWLFYGQFVTRAYARQLKEAVKKRQVETAAQLVAGQRPKPTPALNALVANTEQFVQKERNLLKDYTKVLSLTSATFPDRPAAAEFDKFQEQQLKLQDGFDQLAPEFQEKERAQFLARQTAWEKYRDSQNQAANQDYEGAVEAVEKNVRALDYGKPPGQVSDLLAAIGKQLGNLEALATAQPKGLLVKAPLQQRAAAVQQRQAGFARECAQYFDGMTRLSQARASAEYLEAITQIARSQFTAAPGVKEAGEARTLVAGETELFGLLIFPRDAAAWQAFKGDAQFNFMPHNVARQERNVYEALRDDPALSRKLHRYRLFLNPQKTIQITWITFGQLEETRRWTNIQVYSPDLPTAKFGLRDARYGIFPDYMRLDNQVVYQRENLGPCPETASFYAAQVDQLLRPGGAQYQFRLLSLLDEIKQSTNDSPLFRAWLMLRLFELMDFQKHAWGLMFAPAVTKHRAHLEAVRGDQINSGDWFVPEQIKKYKTPMDEFFASVQAVSYWKQAQGLAALARQALDGGLILVGYLGLEGKPVVNAPATVTELWGHGGKSKLPCLLFVKQGADWVEVEKGVTLSALYALKKSRAEMLSEAQINSQDPNFSGFLPPLFMVQPGAK